MSMIDQVWAKARQTRKSIVLPEGDERRTIQAAARVRDEGLAEPILLGDPEKIRREAGTAGTELDGIPLIDLKADSRTLYRRLGPEQTAKLFVRLAPGEHPDFPDGHDDRTHFNARGAEMICGLVAESLRADERTRAFVR